MEEVPNGTLSSDAVLLAELLLRWATNFSSLPKLPQQAGLLGCHSLAVMFITTSHIEMMKANIFSVKHH